MRFDVWCDEQCSIIREIKRRRDNGELLSSIAQSFHNRRLRLPGGGEWAPKRRGRFSTYTIQRALRFYESLLEKGWTSGIQMPDAWGGNTSPDVIFDNSNEWSRAGV